MSRRLLATPLAVWEREGVKAALIKAALPADDVNDPRVLLWRFETVEGIPVGFGGLEVFGSNALLRSLVTLPPLRQVGMGAIYLLTGSDTTFFARRGYAACAHLDVPANVRGSRQFAALCPPTASAMVKHIG